ncbi:MAG TPA: hypothetical protein GXZ74_03170 [Tissierellia bacterium]|nr:hypothetical protein [Tissierellia bacterium]
MGKVYHIVIGSMTPEAIFSNPADERRMRDYIRIYKERTGLTNYGYSFTDMRLHLAVRDREKKIRDFLIGVCDAYTYHLKNRRFKDIDVKYKLNEVAMKDELFDLLRYIHSKGRNSAKEYRDYTRYVKSELVDVAPILAALHPDDLIGKEMFFEEMIHEPSVGYYVEFSQREIFELDKMTKRRQRAHEYMEAYLEEIGLSRMEFLHGNYHAERVELIERFRRETDLSFRDIGYVFGLSHTSIIRLYREKN